MPDVVSRHYRGFRGVDFRGDDVDLTRSPDSVNMWKDYTKTDAVCTRPSMNTVHSFLDTVYGIFFYSSGGVEMMLVHSGNKLYKVADHQATILYEGVARHRSAAFVYSGAWYFKDGTNYLCFDGATIAPVSGYVPTTSIGRKPEGGGTIYQDVNLLSPYRKNSFVADGKATSFVLDSQNIDEVTNVSVNGITVQNYTSNLTEGSITFNAPPTSPLSDGQDNVVVTFKKTVDGYAERILKSTLLTVFDNRVFFSGNPDYPNMLWHCSLNDPTYCSDLDYYNEGLDTALVRGMVAGNNALWVFREPSDANTTVFYHTPTIDSTYGKIYPSVHSSVATGCIGGAINFGDDIVFFSERGMEGISGDVQSEQAVSHRSSLVDSKMVSMDGYRDMLLGEWEGYLLVCIGSKIFLADSRSTFRYSGATEYDWFYWEATQKIESLCTHNGVLYIGTADGVYSVTGDDSVESWWVTAKDKFGAPSMLKTTNKRGCVVEALGNVEVFAKTESSAFESVGVFQNVTDYFVCRVKRKKFKDLQLKFYSNSRFSLEGATMEAFVGGYIKR